MAADLSVHHPGSSGGGHSPRLSPRSSPRRNTTGAAQIRMRHLYVYFNDASGLLKKDIFGLSDPYVKVFCQGAKDFIAVKRKTSTVKKTLHPKWKEDLEFWVKGNEFSMVYDIYDENLLTKDDFLGRTIMHFDFNDTNPDTRPHTISRPLLNGAEVLNCGRKVELQLKDKYCRELLQSHTHMRHVQQMRATFQHKYQHRKDHAEQRGVLTLHYVVEEGFNSAEVDAVAMGYEVVPRQEGGGASPRSHTISGGTPPSSPAAAAAAAAGGGGRGSGGSGGSGGSQGTDSDTDEEELPQGWEERMDSNGRRLFINHATRAVSLQRPSGQITEREADVARRRFQQRHTSVDVIEQHTAGEESEEETASEAPPHHSAGTPLQPMEPGMGLLAAATAGMGISPQQPQQNLTPQPTLVPAPSVTTPTQPQATPIQPQATPIQLTVTPTQLPATPIHHPTQPSRPQLSTALQRASEGLPPGFEAGMAPDGRIYYINHRTHTTTWEKPRMQERRPTAEESGGNPGIVEQDPELPDGWEMRKSGDGRTYYVNHKSKTTTWDHPGNQSVSGDDLGELASDWEVKQMADGRIFYVDHKTHSTQWEDPRLTAKNKPTARIQYSRDYKQKYVNFRSKLGPRHRIPNQLEVPVRRDRLFEDSYNMIMNVRDIEHLKSRIYVIFQGEAGLDYGGVSREWFYLLSHEMFNPYYGLFEYSASDDYTLQISPESATYNEHHLDYFKFVGRICGLAVYHNRLIDAFFIRPFYKMMLGKPITLDDMQAVDVEMYNSFQYILDNDPEPLYLDFSVNKTVFGEVQEVELKRGGRDIPVTQANKKEYIDLMMKWRFTDRVREQMNAFRNGFSDVIPLHLIKVFDEREVEYLLGGLAEIDVEDWKRNTEYNGYYPNSDVIVWFWKAIESYDNEMRARLLQFVTGTSKVPMNGFAELQGSQGHRKFQLKRYGAPNSLPRAHTCFNRIDLPPYPSYHKLKEMLKLAVENTEGFEGVD